MQSGPPDLQQESALHIPDCQNVLERLTRCVHLILEVSNRGCRNVNLQITRLALENSLRINVIMLTSVSDSSTMEI